MALQQVNNGTHGRYTIPAGFALDLIPTGQAPLVRATSSVSGLGPWGPTSSPALIGPFNVDTVIAVEVLQGQAMVDVIYPGDGAPVTISGVPGVGNLLTAILAAGVTVAGYQWKRDGVAIAGATSSTYLQASPDAGTVLTLSVSGLAYTSGGITVPGSGGGSNLWNDALTWTDTSIWAD